MPDTRQTTDPLISAETLKSKLSAPDVRVVDATWARGWVEGDPDGRTSFNESRIPGAVFFDIDDIAEHLTTLPHMLPRAEKFASRVRRMGIGDGHRIVVYDKNNGFASARVWWMFRVMGVEDVAVLDGGWNAWVEAGGEIDDAPPLLGTERHFTARVRSDLVKSYDQMRRIVETGGVQIVDARPKGRFEGAAPEPRPGLPSGHMPGALNLPASEVFGPDGRYLPEADLLARFRAAGVDPDKPVVTTCGSGVTAAMLALALARIGRWDTPVYDGSWTEWAQREGSPITPAP